MKTLRLLLVGTFTVVAGEYFPLLPMMYEDNSIYQETFLSGGSAVPDKSGGAMLNPGVTNYWHALHKAKIAGSANYYEVTYNTEDPYYKAAASVSATIDKENIVGGEYLFRGSAINGTSTWQRGSVFYSGTLAPESNQGAVYWGVSLSYMNHQGDHVVSHNVTNDTIDYTYSVNQSMHQNMISMDLGFYQAEVLRGLAFSFVFENLFGFQWTTTRPQSVQDTAGIPDSLIDTTDIGGAISTTDWPNKEYNTILAGLSLTLPLWSDNVMLTIPFDARFWGWMNGGLRDRSHVDARIEYHTGADFIVKAGARGPRISTRFGYAYKPEYLKTDEKGLIVLDTWDSFITGGVGVEYRMIRADAIFRNGGWGVEIGTIF